MLNYGFCAFFFWLTGSKESTDSKIVNCTTKPINRLCSHFYYCHRFLECKLVHLAYGVDANYVSRSQLWIDVLYVSGL